MPLPSKSIDRLDELLHDAKAACSGTPVTHNLVLSYSFMIELANEPLGNTFLTQAQLWQQPTKPNELQINHGSYIHRCGNGIQHIISELKNKRDSNRALYSLIDMEDIIGSGDTPIPSFMILQFSMMQEVLFCTAYFRSIEVIEFLPINLTEICLVIQALSHEFHELRTVQLFIHACKAYHKKGFDCLAVAELDRQQRGKVATLVALGKKDEIRDLLKSKLVESSVIKTSGIEEIYTALSTIGDTRDKRYSDAFVHAIGLANTSLEKLRLLREHASASDAVHNQSEQFKKHIAEALRHLDETP